MGVLRTPDCHRPRTPDNVGRLRDELQLPVFRAPPQRLRESDRRFLNGPIVRIRRTREPESHTGKSGNAGTAGWGRRNRRQKTEVSREECTAIVAVIRRAMP